MRYTGTSLTPGEICEIISKCKEAGVCQLSYGELKITLTSEAKGELERLDGAVVGPAAPSVTKSPEERLMELREDALLADPVLYERLMEITNDQEND